MTFKAPLPFAIDRVPKLILDTNIWLDWLVFTDTLIAPIQQAVFKKTVQLVGTQTMCDELADVLTRSYLAERFAQRFERIDSAIAVWLEHTQLVEAAPCATLHCKDADDQMFVDLALAATPAILVSKDRAVLSLAKRARGRGETLIIHPKDWPALVCNP